MNGNILESYLHCVNDKVNTKCKQKDKKIEEQNKITSKDFNVLPGYAPLCDTVLKKYKPFCDMTESAKCLPLSNENPNNNYQMYQRPKAEIWPLKGAGFLVQDED